MEVIFVSGAWNGSRSRLQFICSSMWTLFLLGTGPDLLHVIWSLLWAGQGDPAGWSWRSGNKFGFNDQYRSFTSFGCAQYFITHPKAFSSGKHYHFIYWACNFDILDMDLPRFTTLIYQFQLLSHHTYHIISNIISEIPHIPCVISN